VPGKNRFQILRTSSIRDNESVKLSKSKPQTPVLPNSALLPPPKGGSSLALPIRTAPLEKDRTFREMMSSNMRNRSADRNTAVESEDDSVGHSRREPFSLSSFRDGHGSTLLSNIKSSSSKAADGIGKAGKGIFGKFTRSGSGNDSIAKVDEEHVCKVINLPLVEQTRITRISKELGKSKDKTEFWMPSVPWRCIE
jgi:hypothetical protein